MNFNKKNQMTNLKWTLAMLMGLQLSISSCKKDKVEEKGYQPRPVSSSSSKFISKVYEYMPAPGQFINDAGFGTPALAQDIVVGKARAGLISLGGFGGYMIFGFDHTIENAEGADIGIYGNPLTGEGMEWSEAASVMVMQDLNGNGLPDDGSWLELAGSEYHKTGTIKNYKITYYNPKNTTGDIRWIDNQGKEGYILRNSFHAQAYYPLWINNQNEVSFTGTLVQSTLTAGNIITNKPLSWGYADNGSEDYKQLMDAKGEAYNVFDISWAVDQEGKKVDVRYVDFVKVYTAQNSNGNPYHPLDTDGSRRVGEVSSEIGGAIDLRLHLK